jgi:Lon-like ATP-dependent protease
VQDLGEETFPEPKPDDATFAAQTASQSQEISSERPDATPEPSPEASGDERSPAASPSPSSATSTSSLSEPSTAPTSPADTTPASTEDPHHETTTQQRKPLPIPDSVHVRITPESLKDYVGPPIYQKDRMYLQPPPPGVSTGLGYLGNGSGAVMPVEAMVSLLIQQLISNNDDGLNLCRACQARAACNLRANWAK